MPDLDTEFQAIKAHVSEHCAMAQEQRERNAAFDTIHNTQSQKIRALEQKVSYSEQKIRNIETIAANQTQTIESMLVTINNLTSHLTALQQAVSGYGYQ